MDVGEDEIVTHAIVHEVNCTTLSPATRQCTVTGFIHGTYIFRIVIV